MHVFDVIIVCGYVVGIVAFGVLVSRHIGTFRDYFVAGGRMTTPLLICTLVSTYYGLDVLLGSSEVSYQEGVVSWFAYTRPYYLAILIAAFTIARRLRRLEVLSLPDVAARCYGRGTQCVLAVATFLYALPILGFMGMGVVLDVTLGIPFAWGVVLGAAVSVVYTVVGGLLADALTDTVQFALMCMTLGLAAALALDNAGGVVALEERLAPSFFEPTGTYPVWVLVVFAGTALSAIVEPAFYQRIIAAKSYKAVVIALLVGLVLWAAFDWVVTIVGMTARAQGLETEPRYALLRLTIDVLPVGVKGLFVASVLATAMSTVDSYLLIAGGNLSYDLYRPFARRTIPDGEMLRLTRWMIVVSAVTTVVLALFFQTVVSAWVFMSTTLVAAALVPIVGALYLPRHATPASGLWASVVGLTVAVGYYVVVSAFGTFDSEWATQIWHVTIAGADLELWQEYALLLALPSSAAAFAAGAVLGKRTR